MTTRNSYEIICGCMPQQIMRSMQAVSVERRKNLNEIRLRVGRPVAYVYPDKTLYLHTEGRLQTVPSNDDAVKPNKNDFAKITEILCRFSVHSCARELREGFFTIENGIRVGASGTYSNGERNTIKYISGLNFRIVREINGCAENLYRSLLQNKSANILICGGVNSGKTTLLRDLCRLCGNDRKTVLIDERSELAGCINGVPGMEIGLQTDVIEGSSRSEGILTAIRTLSPRMIFCDEIGNESDVQAIMSGSGSGVCFAATIHAGSFQELMKRRYGAELIKNRLFDYAVILEGEGSPGMIREVRRID